MRTPWAVLAAFALGAAAGAASVLLVRTGEAPAAAVPSPPSETRVAVAEPAPPAPAAVSVPVDAPRGPAATVAATVSAIPPPGGAHPMTLSVEEILERLEAFAGDGPHPSGPVPEALAGELSRRVPRVHVRLDLYESLRSRFRCEGIERLLADGDLLARVRTLAGSMASGTPESSVNEMEFERLAGELAGRKAIKERMTDELAAHPNPRVRRSAAVLAEWPPERPDVLQRLAKDPDREVRGSAFYMIEALLDDRKVSASEFEDLILSGLSDPFEEVRQICQNCLEHLGTKGAAEAVRVLRAGENRDASNGGGPELLRAALAGAPAALLAEPIDARLAEDICLGSGGLGEDDPDLVRILAPQALRLLAALPPHAREPAESFLRALAWVGEADVVRRALRDPALPASIRVEAAEALFELRPAPDWEAAISTWLRDASTPLATRRSFIFNHRQGPSRDDDDPARDEVAPAWRRLLLEVARGAEEPELAAEAWRVLGDTVGR